MTSALLTVRHLVSVDDLRTVTPPTTTLHPGSAWGIAIHGPGGVIGMSVSPAPGSSTEDTLRSVTGIKIGSNATYASNEEFSCS
jgi:hypothetical protein